MKGKAGDREREVNYRLQIGTELGWGTGEKEHDTVKLKVVDSLTKGMW